MPTDTLRERTFAWGDPLVGARAAPSMSGMEYLRAMMRGEFPPPPVAMTLGFTLDEVDDGRAVFGMEPAEFHYNPIGMVHGGVAATLMDSAMGCAVHTRLPAGVGYTTLEMKINLLRAITLDTGPVACEGTLIHLGRTTALAEARITDAAGRLLAHATSTCLIVRP
ncbi:PaaI family thioesterase [Longimicrobium sp.]|uniref:PaaI family thioesterase n=1 Tax=Longimicrobium sp. TaxID=2029185 RepID=UPI002B54DF44|nr:PaaI family thioesterase [Longimicrobium sp.]HSU16680.1 PaaI family thioesterase [Longimicrobium sp.]